MYRYDLHSVRLLIDLVCLPNCVALAFCEQLSGQLARASALTDGAAASDADLALVDDTLQQLRTRAEHARSHAAVLAALRQPSCMVTADWQSELCASWQTMAQTPFFASFLRADLASLAAIQHPPRAAIEEPEQEENGIDGLFGLGATANRNRWAESAADEGHAAIAVVSVGANDAAALRARATLCHFHLQGQCAKGAACEFAHVGPALATVCAFFRAGTCTRGAECAFVHDASVAPCVSGAACTDATCAFSHDLALADFYEATQKRRQLAQR